MANSTQLALFVDPRMPTPDIIRRFWSKVDTSSECWLWTAGKTSGGYGNWTYRVAGKLTQLRAHRFAYLVTHGSLTPGKELHHTCGVTACVRPSHLVELTDAEHSAVTPGSVGHNNARKTHCKRGHELSGDNLLPSGLRRGHRLCRACSIEQSAAWREANPEKFRESVRQYKERNADKVLERNRWYNEHVRGCTPRHGQNGTEPGTG